MNSFRGLFNFFRKPKAGIYRVHGLLSKGRDGSIFLELKSNDEKAIFDLFDRIADRIQRLGAEENISSALNVESRTLSILVSPPQDTKEKKAILKLIKTPQ